MKGWRLLIFYSLFAALAMGLNLAVQRLVLHMSAAVIVYIAALGAGTLSGLVLKYQLDRRYAFVKAAS